MAFKIGLNGKATYGAADSNPATALPSVRDVTVSISSGEAESTDRDSSWKDRLATMREGSAEFDLTNDGTSTAQAALLAACIAKTVLAFKFLDATSGKGLYGNFIISSFQYKAALEDAISVSVKLEMAAKPTFVD